MSGGRGERRWAVTFTLQTSLRTAPIRSLCKRQRPGRPFLGWQLLCTCTALPVAPHAGTLRNHSLRCASHRHCWRGAPHCSFGPHLFAPRRLLGAEKESGSRFAKALKHPSAISTLAHPPASVKTDWKGSWLLTKTAPFHSKTQLASGVHFGTTKLVCALEGQAELSHLTSSTPQTIHFQSVTLYYT